MLCIIYYLTKNKFVDNHETLSAVPLTGDRGQLLLQHLNNLKLIDILLLIAGPLCGPYRLEHERVVTVEFDSTPCEGRDDKIVPGEVR